MTTVAPFFGKHGRATDTQAAEYVRAAQNLFHQLHNGFTGKGVHRVPIAGDTTRLPFVTGLSPLERRMAHAQHFLAKHLAGSQQLRQLMGHTQFGARVNYGDCLFFTVSPNEQHSSLVLRLSRFRKKDPHVQHSSPAVSRLASKEFPSLEAKRQMQSGSGMPTERKGRRELDEERIDFPEYDLRRAATARDPLAVVEGYKVEITLRLAAALGVRMCPRCPQCNDGRMGC